MPTRADLLADVRRMAAELERTPRVVDVLHASEYTRADYRAEFDSWRAVLGAALDSYDLEVPAGELAGRIIELHRTVDPDPSIQTWDEETLYSPADIYACEEWDGWTDAKQSVGVVIWHRSHVPDVEDVGTG